MDGAQCFFPVTRKVTRDSIFQLFVTDVTGKFLAFCHGWKKLSRVRFFGSVTGNLLRVTGRRFIVMSEKTHKYTEKNESAQIFFFVLSRVSRVRFAPVCHGCHG